MVLVGGEAGIGKTTLVRHVAQDAQRLGMLVLSGHAYDLETTPPYGPWREMWRDAAHHSDLPQPPAAGGSDPGGTTPAAPEDVKAAVSRYVIELADQAPLLLVVDDAHWADRASLELLRSLGRRLSEQPILIVATYRDLELRPDQSLARLLPHLVRETRPVRIRLRPLTSPAVEHLVRERYGLARRSAGELVAYLMRTAEGNPFFIGELLAALEDAQILRPNEDGWVLGDLAAASVPYLVRQVIADRLARVSAPTRQLLQVAAVLGTEIQIDLWREVVGPAAGVLEAAIEEAIAVQALVETPDPGRIRFRHALIRQTLYEALPLPRRAGWHRRVGEVLAARPLGDPDEPAYHLWRANDQRAIPWLLRAGDRARELSAPAAVDHYSRAFDMAATFSIDIPAAARLARGQSYATIGEFERAHADVTEALATARARHDRIGEWQALVELGALWSGRDYGRAGDSFVAALRLAEELEDPALLATSQMWVGNWRLNTGHTTQAIHHHHHAQAVFEMLGDQAGIAETAGMLAMDHLIRGDLVGAARYGRQAASIAERYRWQGRLVSAMTALTASGGVYEFATELPAGGNAVDVRHAAEQAPALARDMSWRSGEAFARCALASHLGIRGDYGPALTQARQALALAREIEHREWEALSRTVLGYILTDIMAWEDAIQHLEAAAALGRGFGSFVHIRVTLAALARALAAVGEVEPARTVLAPVLGDLHAAATAVERGCWTVQAELVLAQGDAGSALAIVDHLVATTLNESADQIAPPLGWVRAAALLALGRLDHVEPTLTRAERVVAQAELRSFHWRLGALREDLFARLNRPAERRRARADWQAAAEAVARTIDDANLRAQLLHRALHGKETPPASNRAGLSARELEVLRLAVRGLTNDEIADQLYISSRTVKGHLQSIYGKLGVNTRTGATAFAFEHHLV